MARPRNLHGWNRCLLSGGVQTRFAPSETFWPCLEAELVHAVSARREGRRSAMVAGRAAGECPARFEAFQTVGCRLRSVVHFQFKQDRLILDLVDEIAVGWD
jgi:hypothetical protein